MIELEMAQNELRRIRPLFDQYGWMICLYGSILFDGRGRDIDVMAVARVIDPLDPRSMMRSVYGVTTEPYQGLLGTMAWVVELPIGPLDIQFRLDNPRLTF